MEIKLGFGARKRKDSLKLLDCVLDHIHLSFDCPYCKENLVFGVEFFPDKKPKVTQIVEKPGYIG